MADIDKARWRVESFFKWIERNPGIKSYVGTSGNALLTLIWIAMRVYLLLSYIPFQSGLTKSLRQILRLWPLNLFDQPDPMVLFRGGPIRVHGPDERSLALV